MIAFVSNCSVKITLMLFYPLSVVMTMVATLLRQFTSLLQIRKIITNVLCVLNSQNISINNIEKRMVTYLQDNSCIAKKDAEVTQKKEQ